eukprot:6764716-Prymnesium_polylepis.1
MDGEATRPGVHARARCVPKDDAAAPHGVWRICGSGACGAERLRSPPAAEDKAREGERLGAKVLAAQHAVALEEEHHVRQQLVPGRRAGRVAWAWAHGASGVSGASGRAACSVQRAGGSVRHAHMSRRAPLVLPPEARPRVLAHVPALFIDVQLESQPHAARALPKAPLDGREPSHLLVAARDDDADARARAHVVEGRAGLEQRRR